LRRETENVPAFHLLAFLSSLGEAVFARCLSSLKDERVQASKQLKGPAVTKYSGDKKEFIEHIRKVCLALWSY
jgi:6-phosphogluconate dehydrogenase